MGSAQDGYTRHCGAVTLWRIWGKQKPVSLLLRTEHEALFAQLARALLPHLYLDNAMAGTLGHIGKDILALGDLMQGLIRLTGQLAWMLHIFGVTLHASPGVKFPPTFIELAPRPCPLQRWLAFWSALCLLTCRRSNYTAMAQKC